jgi:hypothetical protein
MADSADTLAQWPIRFHLGRLTGLSAQVVLGLTTRRLTLSAGDRSGSSLKPMTMLTATAGRPILTYCPMPRYV